MTRISERFEDMSAPYNEPAFPVAGHTCQSGFPGMTLRDYFAAAALQGECAAQGSEDFGITSSDEQFSWAAQRAYKFADAMLKARAA